MIGCTYRRAKRLENSTDIRILQRESHLDTKEPETHVPDLPETQCGLAFHFSFASISGLNRTAAPPPAASNNSSMDS
jgi:hypothetical protein